MSGHYHGLPLKDNAHWLVVRILALIPLLCLLTSCATAQPGATILRPAISWPLASEKGRIVWVRTIAEQGDFAVTSGFWRRVLEVASGGDETRDAIVRPYGVLRSAAMLYLTDPGAGRVHCLDIAKNSYAVIGGQGDSVLQSPIGLAEDDTGRLYITDSAAGRVFRYNPQDGSLKPFLTETVERPTGIAFHPLNKMLYIADSKAGQVVVVDLLGVERRRFGGPKGSAVFNRPTDLAIDARGLIYVTDPLNYQIAVLTPEGQLVRQFGEPGDAQGYFSRPKGIGVDSAGNIYVADSLNDVVQVFTQDGALQLAFGSRGVNPGQFWMPSGLFIDRRDQIYVVDTYNKRIQIFRYLPNKGDEDVDNDADLFDKPLTPAR